MTGTQKHTVSYVAGGVVQAGNGAYVERVADDMLLRLCRESIFAYVLTSRQMGKSSLMFRTVGRLIEGGRKTVIIDLSELGAGTTAEQWYRGFLDKVGEHLELRTDVAAWWKDNQSVSLAQRFNRFMSDVVLSEVSEPIVIFIDEIDTTLRLDFTDDFFASIRYLYNARANQKELGRLSFVLLGVASPSDLMKDSQRTPFNIGQRVDLGDFSVEEAVLGLQADRRLVESVFEYTNGHPYLTLRVFRSLIEQPLETTLAARIEVLFFGDQASKDSNLQFVRDMLTKRATELEAVLSRYAAVWSGRRVRNKEADPICSRLRLSGVVRSDGQFLAVRNSIYHKVFDKAWIRRNRRVNWAKRAAVAAGAAVGLLITIAAFLAPFAWRSATNARSNARRSTALGLSAQGLLLQTSSPSQIGLWFLLEVESFRRGQVDSVQAIETQLPLLRKMRARFDGPISSTAFTADRRMLVATSDNTNLRVVDMSNLRELTRITGKGRTNSTALSPDGHLLALGGPVGTSAVFDIGTGREIFTLAWMTQEPPKDATTVSNQAFRINNFVSKVVFSPNGDLVATDGDDVSIPNKGQNVEQAFTSRVFKVSNGEQVALFKHDSPSSSLIFSNDGKFMAADDGVYDVLLGQKLMKIDNKPAADSIVFSPDGSRVAVGIDREAVVFETLSGKEIARLPHPSAVNAVAFSPDDKLIATACTDRIARVFDLSTRQQLAGLGHGDAVISVAFSPDGHFVATGSADRTARIFDALTGAEVARIAHEDTVRSVAFSPDGGQLAISSENRARLFDTARGRDLARIDLSTPADAISLSADRRLVAVIADKSVRIFDIATGRETANFIENSAVKGAVRAVAFSPDTSQVALGGDDNTVTVFEVTTLKQVKRIPCAGPINSVAFSPDGRALAFGGDNGASGVVDIRTGREILPLSWEGEFQSPGHGRLYSGRDMLNSSVLSVTFSRNGKFIATVGSDKLVNSDPSPGLATRVFDLATGKIQAQAFGLDRPIPALLADRSLVLSIPWGADPTLLNIATGQIVSVFSTQHKVISGAFNPDGRLIIFGRDDNSATVFDIASKSELARLIRPARVNFVTFSPDGHLVATASGNTVFIYPWQPNDIVNYTCDHLPFNLTGTDWKHYLGSESYNRTCPNLPDGDPGTG